MFKLIIEVLCVDGFVIDQSICGHFVILFTHIVRYFYFENDMRVNWIFLTNAFVMG